MSEIVYSLPFDQLPVLVEQGWVINRREFDERMLEIRLHVTPPPGWQPPRQIERPLPVRRKHRTGRLAFLLGDLINDAWAERGATHRLILPKGLRIDLMVTSERTRLQLSRVGVYPSDLEWETVAGYWPDELPAGVSPERSQQGSEYFLSASWPTGGGAS